MNHSIPPIEQIDPARLLRTARRLFEEHDLRPSVVMAQSAIEVATENVLGLAFDAKGVSELRDPVLRLFRSYNLTNNSLYRVYHVLTGDDLKNQEAQLWRDLCEHVERRNRIVHYGRRVSETDAEHSVIVAETLVRHLARVLVTPSKDRVAMSKGDYLASTIPDRSDAMPVILDLLADGRTLTSDEIAEAVAAHFELTEEQRTRMRGPHPEYRNEMAFALVRLQALGYIKKPDPARLTYHITDSGSHARSKR